MSEQLPDSIQEIIGTEESRPHKHWPSVEHHVHFYYETSPDDGVALAEFDSDGPLPMPVAGQIIQIHGVPVKVSTVSLGYEAQEDGTPSVFASVFVEPVTAE